MVRINSSPVRVADMVQAAVGMPAKGTLRYQALWRAIKDRPILLQFDDSLRGFFGENLNSARVIEKLPALHGVHKMDFPVVGFAHVAERRRHARLRP